MLSPELVQLIQVGSSVLTPIILYAAFTRGTRKTVQIAIEEIEQKARTSPTAQRLIKAAELTDKLFGDDQAIEQITRFFKEAGDLVSSAEAKNFFANITAALKQFTEAPKTEEPLIDLPPKPKGELK